ncbi:MarR family transcriptional regulator [Streptomyces sp. NPDC051320]|uniref:MarR family transcriptional regulator n=1 Tax=Streptomyces sp. NPDC051320 TaxID=3154644 RepID=UPI0034342659
MAAPGYGKRSAPDRPSPRRSDDFLLLPERERYIAAFVDRLPDGASMTIKALAKQLPSYGQQAVSSALTALSVAGHLRRVRCLTGTGDQVRWAFRTFWSRTARDNEWWVTFLAAEAPAEATAPVPPVTAEPPTAQATTAPTESSVPQQPEPHADHPSPGYLALAQLGCVEPRLALSAADCERLEGLAGEWLARGVTPAYIVQVLAAGLPAEPIVSPFGFVRRRLREKKPPYRPTATTTGAVDAPGSRLMVECTKCGTPGRPQALPDGLCRTCRTVPAAAPPAAQTDARAQVAAHDVHAQVDALRALTRGSDRRVA